MTSYLVQPEKAVPLLQELAAARRRWGRNCRPPYRLEQILDALVLAEDQGALKVPDGPSKEEVTKLRRQLAACLNREKARKCARCDSDNSEDSDK